MRSRQVIALAAFIGSLFCSQAWAFTFTLYEGSTDQSLTWRANTLSATVFSANSEIPLTIGTSGVGNKAGGMLDWTASSGSLKVVAMAVAWTYRSSLGGPNDSWVSVDARTPPSFILIPEAGEQIPFTADLLIRVRILGTLERFTGNTGQAQTIIHMTQAVIVNGLQVTNDALDYDVTYSNGASLVGPVSFPKGTLNNVVVPGVVNGSIITIPIWAYMRGIVTDIGSIDSYGPYGDGLAVEIEISNANAVAVEDEPLAAALSLAASPNPARGPARISYVLPRASDVRLAIYDVGGHKVTTLVDRREGPGRGEVSWDGRSASGDPVAAGIYVMELVAGAERRVQKLVRLGER
jgi:hypothetical protein